MKIHQGAVLTDDPVYDMEAATKRYVDQKIGAAQVAAGLFVTNVTSPGSGIIGDFAYVANTVPTDTVVLEATSDQQVVRIHFLVEADATFYSPTVTVDIPSGSPEVGDNVTAVLTQDTEDLRTFHGYADINIADGLESGRYVYIEASTGATAQVLIKRAPLPPEIQTFVMGTTFPSVSSDPTSGYPGGTQTTLKSGDIFTVTGTVDNNATLVTLTPNDGAVGSGTFTTSTTGGSLGVADSGGAGLKTFTIQFTASGNSGALTAKATPENSFGTPGTETTTSDTVTLDQVSPSIGTISVIYPGTQQALKGSEVATVSSAVSGQDYTYYYTDGNGYISITAPTTYSASKSVTRIGGDYVYNGNNYRIQAWKTSNGTTTSNTTGDVNISNVAPTVAITGASSRLISSPAGQNYSMTLTFNQRLKQAPTIVSSGDSTAGDRGSWSGSGTTWSFTLTVDDADDKGTFNWTVNNATTLSENVYNGVSITGGSSYEIGGFTSRDITVETFEQVVDLGVEISDPTKVTVSYKDSSTLSYKGSDLSNQLQGWSTLNGGSLSYAAGGSPFDQQITYSNYVFQNAATTPTQWFFITDADFAGANTTGTLQITISEVA